MPLEAGSFILGHLGGIWPIGDRDVPTMKEDISVLMANLKFFEEESTRVVCQTVEGKKLSGYEAWAVGKILSNDTMNKEVMYRVLRSLWFTKEIVCFMELYGGVFLVKFGRVEDRERIMSLAPWLFYQCMFSLAPFVKDKEIEAYEFKFVPFWIRIFNMPLE